MKKGIFTTLHALMLAIITCFICTGTVHAKTYFDDQGNALYDGHNFPVLDLVICLDKYKFDGTQWTYYEKGKSITGAPILGTLVSSIKQKEASISSSNLIRELLDQDKQNNLLADINDSKEWLRFITHNQEFVLLIPRKKYNISGISDLESLGINQTLLKELKTIDSDFYTTSEKTQQERLNTLAQTIPPLKSAGLIDHETLCALFLTTKKAKDIMKRVILAGHGFYQEEQIKSHESGTITIKKPQGPTETGAAIAQLRPFQYIKLLDTFQNTGCSFLFVKSCYSGGWNALTAQNEAFYEEKNIFAKFKSVQGTHFIVITESTPDKTAGECDTSKLNTFFSDLNTFFLQEKIKLGNYLNVKNFVCNDIELLRGTFLNPPVNLIDQKPWLKDTLGKIIPSIRSPKIINYSSVRFPGMPYFRFINQTTQEEFDVALEKLNQLNQKKETILKERAAQTKEMNPESPERTQIIEKYWTQLIPLTNEINLLESLLMPLDITYPFLMNYELKHLKDKVKSLVIQYPVAHVLVYPSTILLPLKIKNKFFKILSMIPGRAQHYFKVFEFDTQPALPFSTMSTIFSMQKMQDYPTKLYFIERVSGLADKGGMVSHVCIKVTQKNIDIIYRGQDQLYYDNKTNQKIDEQTARTTIKQWVLETTPAREAIHEATAGMETIYTFRQQVAKDLPGIFSPEELGKKIKTKKQ
jgi:hypothetical protein